MTSLYVHIPFCKKKCNYCDFVSYVGKEELIGQYVDALIREFESLSSVFGAQCSTIYFGGGTPTLLEPNHFERILSNANEITIEANPGTADKTKLKALRELGINRISIGAQTFNDQHLKTLGRIHNSKDIFRFYDNARSAGFDNINLDLIFALPGQTLEEWKNDLKTALSLKPDHLSTYNLQIEKNTPLWRMTNNEARMTNEIPIINYQFPSEEEELDMYEYAIDTLIAKGYNHYEISNFAKPGFECQHNINYWKNGNYIGVGAGAHSHVDGERWSNPNSVEEYIDRPSQPINVSSRATDQRETIFMGLRLLDGISTDNFAGFEKEVQELTEDGLLTHENDHYKLTRKGLYLGNLVFEKFV